MIVLLASACAPGSVRAGGYAGMSRGEALNEVVSYARDEMVARAGPLTHHDLQLMRVYKGKTSAGAKAWVGRFQDRTDRGPVCVRVWKTDETIVSENFDAEVDDCTVESPLPPPPAA